VLIYTARLGLKSPFTPAAEVGNNIQESKKYNTFGVLKFYIFPPKLKIFLNTITLPFFTSSAPLLLVLPLFHKLSPSSTKFTNLLFIQCCTK
jgi:hypothetical protein